MFLDQLFEAEHHGRTARRWHCCPGRKGAGGSRHCLVDVCSRAECDLFGDFAGGWIGDRRGGVAAG
jgi:hypothetical protein